MALLITGSCINCDMCEPECPNQAISLGDEVYEIDPSRCTECKGHYPEPTCVKVCPIDCVMSPVELKETDDVLLARFYALQAAQRSH